MDGTALWSLVGVLIGGGIAAARDAIVRREERRATLAALVAEAAALIEVAEARGLIASLRRFQAELERLVGTGDGDTVVQFPRFPMKRGYFTVYESLVAKLGLLRPDHAALISAFNTTTRSSLEMLAWRSEADAPCAAPAARMIDHLRMEIPLAERAVALGRAVAAIRVAKG